MSVHSLARRGTLDAAVQTHVGSVRARNEDAVDLARISLGAAGEGILVTVADGMGGVAGGATASALTVQVVAEALPELAPCFATRDAEWQRRAASWLRATATRANDSVRQLAVDEPSLAGMGSTLLLGLIVDGWLGVAWVGDSRAYLLRGRTLVQLTRDHSWDMDRELEGAGDDPSVLASPYRGMLTSVIGRTETTEIGVRWEALEAGDLMVFATDGLTGYYDGEPLAGALVDGLAAGADAAGLAAQLIAWANAAGGSDNISVGVVRNAGTSARLPAPTAVTQSPVPHRAWQAPAVLPPVAMRAPLSSRRRRVLGLSAASLLALTVGAGSTALYLAEERQGAAGSYGVTFSGAASDNGSGGLSARDAAGDSVVLADASATEAAERVSRPDERVTASAAPMRDTALARGFVPRAGATTSNAAVGADSAPRLGLPTTSIARAPVARGEITGASVAPDSLARRQAADDAATMTKPDRLDSTSRAGAPATGPSARPLDTSLRASAPLKTDGAVGRDQASDFGKDGDAEGGRFAKVRRRASRLVCRITFRDCNDDPAPPVRDSSAGRRRPDSSAVDGAIHSALRASPSDDPSAHGRTVGSTLTLRTSS